MFSPFYQFCHQGTDQTMLNKLHQTHENNKNYLRPKADINRVFGINHFAGVVFYDSKGLYLLLYCFFVFEDNLIIVRQALF